MLNNNTTMDEVIPLKFHLSQNYPNPFKEKTVIKYCVAYKTRVVLTVYNSEDEVIEKLIDEEKKPGTYEIEFHSAAGNRQLATGNYYYRLEADPLSSLPAGRQGAGRVFVQTKKMILIA
jgi:hypothetical protein